jgi:hypothetical protein
MDESQEVVIAEVSATGKLYIKTTRPANDTDGTVVGTQT